MLCVHRNGDLGTAELLRCYHVVVVRLLLLSARLVSVLFYFVAVVSVLRMPSSGMLLNVFLKSTRFDMFLTWRTLRYACLQSFWGSGGQTIIAAC